MVQLTTQSGYLKNKVFATPPQNIEELRQRIIDEFNVLRQRPEMIRYAVRNMHKRTIICVERDGGRIEGHGPYLFLKAKSVNSCNISRKRFVCKIVLLASIIAINYFDK